MKPPIKGFKILTNLRRMDHFRGYLISLLIAKWLARNRRNY